MAIRRGKESDEAPEKLDAYIRRHEDAAMRRGAVVVEVTHPSAVEQPTIYTGRYGGVRVSKGGAGAKYSDGHTSK